MAFCTCRGQLFFSFSLEIVFEKVGNVVVVVVVVVVVDVEAELLLLLLPQTRSLTLKNPALLLKIVNVVGVGKTG